jgi:FkbM family methyltransferase
MIASYLKLFHRAWRYRLADKCEINYLLNTIKKNETAFDIGAHKAGYTYWMKKAVGKNGKVIAFEPQQNAFHFLTHLKKTLHLKNVLIEPFAVSDKIGQSDIFILQQNNKISYEASLHNKYLKNYSRQNVFTTTIDSYCGLHDLQPQFIKIDVEGHELEVLHGAIDTLRSKRPKILLECEQRHVGKEKVQACFNFMKQLNYKGYFIFNNKIEPIAAFDFEKHQPVKLTRKSEYCNNFIFE